MTSGSAAAAASPSTSGRTFGTRQRDTDDDAVLVVEQLSLPRGVEIGDAKELHGHPRPVTSRSIVSGMESGKTLDMKLAKLKVDDAAFALHALRNAGDVNRDGDADDLVHDHAHEIDVRQLPGDRVHLHVLDHGVTLLIGAGHLQEENRADAVFTLLDQVGKISSASTLMRTGSRCPP